MNTLTLKTRSDLYTTILRKYQLSSSYGWVTFVKSLDENITDVSWSSPVLMHITFKDEISKTFFILKYS